MSAIRFEGLGGQVVELRRSPIRPARMHVARRIWVRLREWRRRTKARAELAGLDERMLADIGITRADAEFLANRPFWKE